MEINETLVISFLVVVILILIFSKISIGNSDESTIIDEKLRQIENKLIVSRSTNPPKFDPKSNELLSPEFKKQLDEIESKFYYNNCGGKKL
jgi:hypothetical protein